MAFKILGKEHIQVSHHKGRYWWAYGMPGCLPDTDWYGPHSTFKAAYRGAINDVLENNDFGSYGVPYPTAEQIADTCEGLNKADINKIYKEFDESHLWPINGKFNATKEAINASRYFQRATGENLQGLAYCYFLEEHISRLVNNF